MYIDQASPSLWFVEPSHDLDETNRLANAADKYSLISHYPCSSSYRAETLIDGHLRQHWNTCSTKIVAVNQLILGLLILTIGLLMIFLQLTALSTAHGVWTGAIAFLAGIAAFLTIIYRRHRFFLIVATIHIIAGLLSTIMMFISGLAIAMQVNTASSPVPTTDRQLYYGLHVTLIILGLYEKFLCYTFLIMIIRHTHKMV